MASCCPKEQLQKAATCSICLGYFVNPVSLYCRHHFCSDCIYRTWAGMPTEPACPCCGRRAQPENLMPNRKMVAFVEIIKQVCETPQQEAEQERLCEEHQKPCLLFCKQDNLLLCSVCEQSGEHQAHHMVSVEEAAQAYKDRIHSLLADLRMDRKNCLLKKAKAETESQELLKQTDHEREVFVSELKHLQDFLEGYQDCFLEKLTIVENKVNGKSREFMAELTKDLDFLKKASEELERRCLLPKTQLLQDVGHALPMYTQEIRKMALPFELKWKSWDLLDTNYVLDDVLDQFKDVMSSALLQLEKVNVTLDLEGLHPQVVFSEDHQSMTWRRPEGLLGNLEQAGELSVVLGKEKLYFARYFWEVDVGSEEDWAVGVGTEYMDLEGIAISGPREGIWAFGKWMGKYRAVSPTEFTDVSLKGSPRRIRVCVNGGGERVSFLDADTAVLLYMLSLVIVPSEPFRPFFWVCNKGHLQLNPSGS